jgi:hypothetical protein
MILMKYVDNFVKIASLLSIETKEIVSNIVIYVLH